MLQGLFYGFGILCLDLPGDQVIDISTDLGRVDMIPIHAGFDCLPVAQKKFNLGLCLAPFYGTICPDSIEVSYFVFCPPPSNLHPHAPVFLVWYSRMALWPWDVQPGILLRTPALPSNRYSRSSDTGHRNYRPAISLFSGGHGHTWRICNHYKSSLDEL